MPFSKSNKEQQTITIRSSHIFANTTDRDTYFTSHTAEKVNGVLISVASGYQEWNGTSWIDKTSVIDIVPYIISGTAPTNTTSMWVKKI